MARLLVVHHTPSPSLAALFDAVCAGASDPAIEGVEVVARPALVASAAEALEADGYLLGTPANLGYISGALKHFFDEIYYPCLEATVGRPYACYVHGGSDVTGAVRAIETITTGLGWRRVHQPLEVIGAVGLEAERSAYELGATISARLANPLD